MSWERYRSTATWVLAVFFAVGTVCHLIPATLPLMLRLTPAVLLLSGAAALVPALRDAKPMLPVWAVLVFAATFILEALGTATGAIFGPYVYGNSLGFKVLAVPPIIAFNWFVVILGCLDLSLGMTRKPLPSAFIAAGLAALFDFLMEPAAIRLDYWTWHGPIPLQNYAAWFLIAFAAALPFTLSRFEVGDRLPSRLVLVQAGFFAALRVAWIFGAP